MKNYGTSKIRNVCLLAHGSAGKSTLAEAMLYNTGVLDRFGKIVDGTTTTDYDPEEIKRKFSINAALAPCEWKDSKINVIDVPGYFDFVGEVYQGLRVSDGAVIVVSAKDGVEVGTEKSWDYVTDRKMPRFIFINKMDEENINFDNVYSQLTELAGTGCVAFQLPIIESGKFTGYVDLISGKAKKFDKGDVTDIEVPSNLEDKLSDLMLHLKEAVAETDEELMEKYFSGEEFTREEIIKGLSLGVKSGSITPVFCGSAFNNLGVKQLMDSIVELMPSPADADKIKATDANSNDITIEPKEDGPLAAFVFKTIADPFVGRISIFRVYSGTLTSDSVVYNPNLQSDEKIGQLFVLRGKKHINVDKLTAGDIGAVAKLSNTNTNHTICTKANPIILEQIDFPAPAISLAIEPKAKGDEEKITAGLSRLQDEDPTFKVEMNNETHQIVISGIGEQHLDIVCSKLKSKYGVSVNLTEPKIPYRETIKKKVKVEGKHKKQSGGHGQYGHVWIEFEPCDSETLVFEEKVFGGAVPKNYFPAVEKGLQESVRKGVLAGYPVVNLKATLLDGSYHPVDSSEMAFKIAANLAYRKGLAEANPVILEPINRVEVYIPERFMGDIIGDLNKRRGRILGMNPMDKGIQQVVAEVPASELAKYATDLKSMTQGRGYFSTEFVRYEEAPANIAQKVIEEAKRSADDENAG